LVAFLDETQAVMHFPLPKVTHGINGVNGITNGHAGTANGLGGIIGHAIGASGGQVRASQVFNYTFNGRISVECPEWNMFGHIKTLVLKEVKLDMVVDNKEPEFSVAKGYLDLRARCTIAEKALQATARIPLFPNPSKGLRDHFELTLKADTSSQALDVRKLIGHFTKEFDCDAELFHAASPLPDYFSTLIKEAAIQNVRLTVCLTAGGDYYLKNIDFDHGPSFDWNPVPHFNVKNTLVHVSIRRKGPHEKWDWEVVLTGEIFVKGHVVRVGSIFNRSTKVYSPKKRLELRADILDRDGFSKFDAKILFDTLIYSPDHTAGHYAIQELRQRLPPRMNQYIEQLQVTGVRLAKISAVITLEELGGNAPKGQWWNQLDARVTSFSEWFDWRPNKDLKIHDLQLALIAERSESDWKYRGIAKTNITLRGHQFPAQVHYDAILKQTILRISYTSVEKNAPSLAGLAGDITLVKDPKSPVDLVAWVHGRPLLEPKGCPIGFKLLSDQYTTSGTRTFDICISDDTTELSQVLLGFKTGIDWANLTSRITLRSLGTHITIAKPGVGHRSITGYVYGELNLMQRNIQLIGSNIPERNKSNPEEFWFSFAKKGGEVGPYTKLGVPPGEILQENMFGAHTIPFNGWRIPAFVTNISTAITSVTSQLLVRFSKSTSTRELSKIIVRDVAPRPWTIWGDLHLTNARLDVIVERNINTLGQEGHTLATEYYGLTKLSGFWAEFTARFEHSNNYENSYEALVHVWAGDSTSDRSRLATAYTIARLPLFGSCQIDLVGEVRKRIPEGFPITADEFISKATERLTVCAVVNKPQTTPAWNLGSLNFSMTEKSVWRLTERITSTFTMVTLKIPMTIPHVVRFSATSKLDIGSLCGVDAEISVEGQMTKITISRGRISAILDELFGAGYYRRIIPHDCQVALGEDQAQFTLELFLAKGINQLWTLSKATLVLTPVRENPWNIGGKLTVRELSMKVLIQVDLKAPGGLISTVTGYGKVAFGGKDVKVHKDVKVRLDIVEQEITVILSEAVANLKEIVSTFFINYDAARCLPNIPSDTGLIGYRDTPATARITFIHSGVHWNPTKATVSVPSPVHRWVLAEHIMVINKLSLEITYANILEPTKNCACYIKGWFDIGKVEHQLTLTVTDSGMKANLMDYVKGCSFVDVVSRLTGGFWQLMGATHEVKKFSTLELFLTWPEGTMRAAISGNCGTWNLNRLGLHTKSLTTVYETTLQLLVQKDSCGLTPSAGWSSLNGYCNVVEGVKIPVSFSLPDGPLRLYRRLYKTTHILEMVQLLHKDLPLVVPGKNANWQAFHKGLAIGWMVVDITGKGGEVERILRQALLCQGGAYLVADVEKIIVEIFGHIDDGDVKPVLWIESGPGLSDGPAEAFVDVIIEPLDYRRKHVNINTDYLCINIRDSEGTLIKSWDIADKRQDGPGYVVRYVRPRVTGPYQVEVLYDDIDDAYDYRKIYTVHIINEAPELWPELKVKGVLHTGIPCTAQVTYRDQFGKTRSGYPDDFPRFQVRFEPQLGGVSLKPYTDHFDINFTLPQSYDDKLEYKLHVTMDNKAIRGSGALIKPIVSLYPATCKTWGPGICSGQAGEMVEFTVELLDQFGGACLEQEVSRTKLEVSGRCTDTLDSFTIKRLGVRKGTTHEIVYEYERPLEPNYEIRILINDFELSCSPFSLKSYGGIRGGDLEAECPPLFLSVPKSTMTIETLDVVAGSTMRITITAYDNLGNRIWRGGDHKKFRCVSKFDKVVADCTFVRDNRDGSYLWTYTVPDIKTNDPKDLDGKIVEIMATSANEKEYCWGSPMQIRILPKRVPTSVRCYGPGLGSGLENENTSFDIEVLDQKGTLIRAQDQERPPFEVYILNGSKLDIKRLHRWQDDYQCNRWTVTYQRPKRGPDSKDLQLYTIIRVLLNGEEAQDSPYLAYSFGDQIPVLTPEYCMIEWLTQEKGLNDTHEARIYAVDQYRRRMFIGGQKVTVAAESGYEKNVDFSNRIAEDNHDGTYTIKYKPLKKEVRFRLKFSASRHSQKEEATVYHAPVGAQALQRIDVRPYKGTKFEAELGIDAFISFTGEEIKTTFQENSGYSYFLVYPSRPSSEHQLGAFVHTEIEKVNKFQLPYDTPGVPIGDYTIKVFWNYTGSHSRVKTSVIPILIRNMLNIDVSGWETEWHDWCGTVTEGVKPNTLIFSPDLDGAELDPTLLRFKVEEDATRMAFRRELPKLTILKHLFHWTLSRRSDGCIEAKWGLAYGQVEALLSFTYRGKLIRTPSGEEAWRIVVDDSAKSLNQWRVEYPEAVDPEKRCYISEGSGLRVLHDGQQLSKVDGEEGPEPGRLIIRKKAKWSGFNQWAGVRWPILNPLTLKAPDGFIFHYRIKWHRWQNAGDIRLYAPVDLSGKGRRAAVLRCTKAPNQPTESASWAVQDTRSNQPSKLYANHKASNVLDGKWHNILFMYTSTHLYIYEDGHLVLEENRDNNLPIDAVNIRMISKERKGKVLVEFKAVKSYPMSFQHNENLNWHSMMSWNDIVLTNHQADQPFYEFEAKGAGLQLEPSDRGLTVKAIITPGAGPGSTLRIKPLYRQWGADWPEHGDVLQPLKNRSLTAYSIVQYRFRIVKATKGSTVIKFCNNDLIDFISLNVQGVSNGLAHLTWGLDKSLNATGQESKAYSKEVGQWVNITILLSPKQVLIWDSDRRVLNQQPQQAQWPTKIKPNITVAHTVSGSEAELQFSRIRVPIGVDISDGDKPGKWWKNGTNTFVEGSSKTCHRCKSGGHECHDD